MRPLLLLAPLAVVAALFPTPALAEEPADAVSSFVTQRMADTGVTGAALSIVEGDEVVYDERFGHTGDGDPIEADTAFMWGSIAKPMTAAVVLRLAEDKRLDPSDPVAEYLPDFRPRFDGEPTEPTVAQLLSHTAGLPGIEGADVTDHDGRTASVSSVAAQLDDVALTSRPGTKHRYSSLNYLLLGAVVEAVTQRSFDEVLTERVLRPLGMDDTVRDAKTAATRLPSGNRLWFGHPIAQRTPFDESGLPYGYLGGTQPDLTAFARAALNRDEEILGAAGWRSAQSPQTTTAGGHYGYGWSIRELGGETVVFHTGMTPGYHVNVLLVPQRDLAVVLTQNSYAEAWALPLRSTSEDVISLWTGREPAPAPGPDSLLATAPWVLGSLALLLLLVAGVSAIRRGRDPEPSLPTEPNRPDASGPTSADSAEHRLPDPAPPMPAHTAEQRRSRSGRTRARLRLASWAAVGVAAPLLLLWQLPLWLGVPVRMLWLFQPDLAASLTALAVAALLLAVVRCVRLVKPARRAE